MTRLRFLCLASVLVMAACGTRPTEPGQPGDVARGALLYDTACVQCHAEKPHWRDRRVATSWETLVSEVDRWRKISGQQWDAAEIRDVAAYLNQRFYRFPAPGRS